MIVLPGGDPRPSDGTRAAAASSSRRAAEAGGQRRLPAGPARLPPGPAVRGTACPAGLEQRQAGMLVRLAENDGKSQQAIAELLGVNATRMVFLTDELEQLGLVERRRNPADRRSHALHLTEAG